MKTIKTLYFWFILLLVTSCTTSTDQLPQMNTEVISNVTTTSAYCSANIISDGGATVTERGICWSTRPDPTIKNFKTSDGQGIGSFQDSLLNLSPATTYYVRAYAININGTAYGKITVLTTPNEVGTTSPVLNNDLTYGTATDIAGNIYKTITIGTQTWMAQNLAVTKYRNGDAIQNETDNLKWNRLTTGAQCTYENNSESNTIIKFGRLYNYYAVVDTRNLAPAGWHIATDAEWSILSDYLTTHLGTSTTVAQALASKSDWTESNVLGAIGFMDPETYTSLNNSSGFSGLAAGYRAEYGEYSYIKNYTAWWTADNNDKQTAKFRSMNYYSKNTSSEFIKKQYGLSVRCIKD